MIYLQNIEATEKTWNYCAHKKQMSSVPLHEISTLCCVCRIYILLWKDQPVTGCVERGGPLHLAFPSA